MHTHINIQNNAKNIKEKTTPHRYGTEKSR